MTNATLYISVSDNGSIELPATGRLAAAGSQSGQHVSLGMRQPVAAYSTSIGTLGTRFDRVLDLLPPILNSPARGPDRSGIDLFVDTYEALLQALMQYMEECLNIAKALSPDVTRFGKEPCAQRYGKAVREYRDHIGRVANGIKHRQGRLRLLIAQLQNGQRFLGYFVERGIDRITVGPDPDIHSGGNTAFSVNRDLRYHLCNVLLVSHHLANVAECFHKDVVPAQATTPSSALSSALRVISELPETYFPDEYQKPRPRLHFRDRLLEVGFLAPPASPFAGQTFQLTALLRGDGASTAYKVPYGHGIQRNA